MRAMSSHPCRARVEAVDHQVDNVTRKPEIDEAHALRLDRKSARRRWRAVEGGDPPGRKQRSTTEAAGVGEEQRERDCRRRRLHAPANLECPSHEVSGLRPGAGGVAQDLVEHGVLEPLADLLAERFSEDPALYLRAREERQDRW